MTVNRLLRSQRLAKKAAARDEGLAFNEAVRLMNEAVRRDNGGVLFAPSPPLEVPTRQPLSASPLSAKAKPVSLTAPAPRVHQWWEERCRWRERTAADDGNPAENDNNEVDDLLGIYR